MQHSYMGKWLLVPAVLIALLVSPGAFAQETTAGVQGVVRDPSGASIANAIVEISGVSLLGNRKVKSDDAGAYRITALPPGSYTMTVTAPGFRTFKQVGIDLAVGRLPTLDVKLEVGAVAETVEVSGSATMVDTSQSKVAVTVEQQVLDNLPKGRSFQSLIPLAPGARAEAAAERQHHRRAASAGTATRSMAPATAKTSTSWMASTSPTSRTAASARATRWSSSTKSRSRPAASKPSSAAPSAA